MTEFLNIFKCSENTNSNEFNLFDKSFHSSDWLINILNNYKKSFSNPDENTLEEIILKAKTISNTLEKADKIKILLFIIANHFNVLLNGNEASLYRIGNSMDVSECEIKDILDFYFSEELFTDKENAIYFINEKDNCSYKQICVNVETYATENTTYIKYLKISKIFLTKSFANKTINCFVSDNYLVNGIRVITEANYNRFDFGLYTMNELIEKTERFNSIMFYEIQGTSNSPKIILDPELGKVVISGNSSPLSPTNFFNPIYDWINAYKSSGKDSLDIYIILDYFNTYTSKSLMKLTREAKSLSVNGCTTNLYWYCSVDDDDMREFGEHLQSVNKNGVKLCFINEESVA